MRILAYEHFTALGAAAPPALRTEGGAMLAALAADLAHAGHEVSVTVGPGAGLGWEGVLRSAGVRILGDRSPEGGPELPEEGAAAAEAVWIVAPETGGCLRSLTEDALRVGRRVLGSAPEAIGVAASKLRTACALRSAGVPVVPTARVAPGGKDSPRTARGLPPEASGWRFPLVVKPDDGVGCEGVGLVRACRELSAAGRRARTHSTEVVVQPFVEGDPASACLLVAAGRAFPLSLQRQHLETGAAFRYRGGEVPLGSPRADEALEVARAACEAIAGLDGFVGVDLVLGASGPVVIEVNPRLTTSYLGLRRAVRENVASLALRALDGKPPGRLTWLRRVVYRTSGEVTEEPLAPVGGTSRSGAPAGVDGGGARRRG